MASEPRLQLEPSNIEFDSDEQVLWSGRPHGWRALIGRQDLLLVPISLVFSVLLLAFNLELWSIVTDPAVEDGPWMIVAPVLSVLSAGMIAYVTAGRFAHVRSVNEGIEYLLTTRRVVIRDDGQRHDGRELMLTPGLEVKVRRLPFAAAIVFRPDEPGRMIDPRNESILWWLDPHGDRFRFDGVEDVDRVAGAIANAVVATMDDRHDELPQWVVDARHRLRAVSPIPDQLQDEVQVRD